MKSAGKDIREIWRARGNVMRALAGVRSAEEWLESNRKAREQRARLHQAPRNAADPGTPLRGEAQVHGPKGAGLRVASARSPVKTLSFGSTRRFVKVSAKQAFAKATLRFRVSKTKSRHLRAGTITVARWDGESKRFRLVPHSGFNIERGYAYARISRPGVYTAVGLPRDPRLVTTLRLMRAAEPWSSQAKWGDLRRNICQAVLCNSQIGRAVKQLVTHGDGPLADAGYSSDDFDGFTGGGSICDQCLNMPGPDLTPEIPLLPEGGDVPVLEPADPVVWPSPCTTWESIGPTNVPGRITSLAIDPTAYPDGHRVLYAGAADGGVFKSVDSGTTWAPKWQDQLSLSIGALAVSLSHPNVVYASTGRWVFPSGFDGLIFPPGVGLYRSDDYGETWRLCAPIDSKYTNAVAVDPANPDRVYVGGEYGLHRSSDGGLSWDVTPDGLSPLWRFVEGTRTDIGGISDVVFDPRIAGRLLIGIHQVGVKESLDGGTTWHELAQDLEVVTSPYAPRIAFGREGLHGTRFVVVKIGDITRQTFPNTGDYGRIFASEDGGAHFTELTPVNDVTNGDGADYYTYANALAVDPKDEKRLITGSVVLQGSTDGGLTWPLLDMSRHVHPDIQALVFDPHNHLRIYVATDGGVSESTDGGDTWADRSNGLVTTQCYHIGVSQTSRLDVGITTQDNFCYHSSGSGEFASFGVFSEGGWIEYDPDDANVIYADDFQRNSAAKSTDGGLHWHSLGIKTTGLGDTFRKPFALAGGTSTVLLAGNFGGSLLRSPDRGGTWATVLSLAGDEFTAMRFAPFDPALAYAGTLAAYAGTLRGRLWTSADVGNTWTEIPPGYPATSVPPVVQALAVDWHDPGRVFAVFNTFGSSTIYRIDIRPGQPPRWWDVTGGPGGRLPNVPVTSIVLDPRFEEILYAATRLGVYWSTDGGESWAPFDAGLPNCVVSEMQLRVPDMTLYASTFGRGVFRRRL